MRTGVFDARSIGENGKCGIIGEILLVRNAMRDECEPYIIVECEPYIIVEESDALQQSMMNLANQNDLK